MASEIRYGVQDGYILQPFATVGDMLVTVPTFTEDPQNEGVFTGTLTNFTLLGIYTKNPITGNEKFYQVTFGGLDTAEIELGGGTLYFREFFTIISEVATNAYVAANAFRDQKILEHVGFQQQFNGFPEGVA